MGERELMAVHWPWAEPRPGSITFNSNGNAMLLIEISMAVSSASTLFDTEKRQRTSQWLSHIRTMPSCEQVIQIRRKKEQEGKQRVEMER